MTQDEHRLLDQLDDLLTHLREGDDGTKPARDFMEKTLYEARVIVHRLRKGQAKESQPHESVSGKV